MKLDNKTFQKTKILWQKRMKNATSATGEKKLPLSLRYVKTAAQTAVRWVGKVCRDVVHVIKPTICTYGTYAVIEYSLLHVPALDSHFSLTQSQRQYSVILYVLCVCVCVCVCVCACVCASCWFHNMNYVYISLHGMTTNIKVGCENLCSLKFRVVGLVIFDVHKAVHRNIISTVKPTRCTNVSNLFYFGITLYMFRTVFPSIISSSRLYIQQQAFVEQIQLSAC